MCRRPIAPGMGVSAPPALDWWRGFRSRELTRLVEEAQTEQSRHRGRDCAHRPGRRAEQDRGAPLLPQSPRRPTWRRARGSQTAGPADRCRRTIGARAIHGGAQRELRDRFLGQEPRALRAAEESAIAQPLRPRGGRSLHVVSVATTYFQVLAAQDRLRIARENVAAASRILTLDQAARRRRHRVRARRRAAGDPGRAGARAIPPLDQTVAPEHRHARGADRPRAGAISTVRGGSLDSARASRASPRAAVRAAVAAARHPRGRGATRPPTPTWKRRAPHSSRASR